jgi:hypothetical protein
MVQVWLTEPRWPANLLRVGNDIHVPSDLERIRVVRDLRSRPQRQARRRVRVPRCVGATGSRPSLSRHARPQLPTRPDRNAAAAQPTTKRTGADFHATRPLPRVKWLDE